MNSASPIPGRDIALHIGLDHLAIARKKAEGKAEEWAFDGAIRASFTGLPSAIQDRLAEQSVGRLMVSNTKVDISIDRVFRPIEIPLPKAEFGAVGLDLGIMALDASNLALKLDADSLSLSINLGAGLPSELNNIFGQHEDGSPAVNLFNTYNVDDPDSILNLRLSLDTKDGMSIRALTSPIAAINLRDDGDDTYCDLNLGDFGACSFMVPEFSFDGYSFIARGRFEQTKEFAIPRVSAHYPAREVRVRH